MIASHEAFAAGASELSRIRWEATVLDERHRVRAALIKAYHAMVELVARYRLLLSGPSQAGKIDDLMTRVAFLHPQYQSLEDVPGKLEEKDEAQQVSFAICLYLIPLQNEVHTVCY